MPKYEKMKKCRWSEEPVDMVPGEEYEVCRHAVNGECPTLCPRVVAMEGDRESKILLLIQGYGDVISSALDQIIELKGRLASVEAWLARLDRRYDVHMFQHHKPV